MRPAALFSALVVAPLVGCDLLLPTMRSLFDADYVPPAGGGGRLYVLLGSLQSGTSFAYDGPLPTVNVASQASCPRASGMVVSLHSADRLVLPAARAALARRHRRPSRARPACGARSRRSGPGRATAATARTRACSSSCASWRARRRSITGAGRRCTSA